MSEIVKAARYPSSFFGFFPGFLPVANRLARICVIDAVRKLVAFGAILFSREYEMVRLALRKRSSPENENLISPVIERITLPVPASDGSNETLKRSRRAEGI